VSEAEAPALLGIAKASLMEFPMQGDGKRVLGAIEGGPTNFGQALRFALKFEDGSVEPFHVRYEDFLKFLHALRTFGAITEKTRRAMPGQPVDLVTPYVVTDTKTGTASNEAIAILFQTEDGPPLVTIMTRSQTNTLVEQLRSQLKKPPPRTS
jgi:hypothetical protein